MKALTENAKEKLANFKQSITFEILNARSWVNPFFSVIIDDEIQVSPEPVSSETSIKVDSDVLTSILLGETDPLRAFLEGKLKIKPLHKIFKALKFLGTIRLHNSWFYSLADYG
jgi:putative sterol carrier protein